MTKNGMKQGYNGNMVMTSFRKIKQGSPGRMESLLKELQKELKLLAQNDEVIEDQLAKGIIERVLSNPVGSKF